MQATGTTVQTGSVSIPQIFPTQDMAMNARLSTCLAEISPNTRNQKGFVRDCDEAKTGFASATDWIGEINRICALGATNTLELARIVFRARRTMRYGAWARMWRSKRLPFAISKAKMLV